jgi:hypothetical protein
MQASPGHELFFCHSQGPDTTSCRPHELAYAVCEQNACAKRRLTTALPPDQSVSPPPRKSRLEIVAFTHGRAKNPLSSTARPCCQYIRSAPLSPSQCRDAWSTAQSAQLIMQPPLARAHASAASACAPAAPPQLPEGLQPLTYFLPSAAFSRSSRLSLCCCSSIIQ